MKKYIFNSNKLIIISLSALMLISFGGCSSEEPEEEIVYIAEEESTIEYEMFSVIRDDCISSKNINCSYQSTQEQEISFGVGGKRIEKVFVKEGDTVKAGDVLVELEIGNLEEDIARKEYDIAKIKLEDSFLDTQKDFELTDSYLTFSYRSSFSEDDIEAKTKRDEEIEQNYRYKHEDYADELEFDERELSKMKGELKSSKLYSSMSGTIRKIKENLEGSTSRKGEVIMTISNGSSGVFVSKDESIKDCFKDGDIIALSVSYGDAKGDYEVTPYNMSSWGAEQYFSIVTGPEVDEIEMGTSASMRVITDRRDNVLVVPNSAVHVADGKSYVYVLDADGMRAVKWIESGMVGDDYVEVISGLDENEQIIRK